jgi:N4-gp56 family major capsid protein
MQTNIAVGSPLAIKRWANSLALDTEKLMFFSKFIGKGDSNIIERKTELEGDAGDRVQFDILMNMRGGMTYGDDTVEGKEENLSFYSDEVKIDQARKGTDAGGRMSRKRTLHDLRDAAKKATARFTSEWFDELFFVYLSGTLAGINPDAKVTTAFAGNPVQAPDPYHMVYGGAATSAATLTAADTMSRDLIERIGVMPRMMSTLNPDVTRMAPVVVEGGGKHFVLLMNPFQAHSLRIEKSELSWADIQKAAASSEGRNNPLFKGGLGMLNDVVLHQHENVRFFSNYGAGGNVGAARALFMGAQAGVVAYGEAGNGTRFQWTEELKDAKNRVAIYAGVIAGAKKTRFNGYDYGVIAVDTAASNPNPAIAA